MYRDEIVYLDHASVAQFKGFSNSVPRLPSGLPRPKYRATLTGLYGAFWYVGGILAACVTYGSQYIDSTWSWRLPSLLQFLPSILCLAPLPFIPESPRWLMYQDQHEEARAMLVKWHGNGDPDSTVVALEYEEIAQTLAFETTIQNTDFKALFATKPNRWRMGCNIAVADIRVVFCQLSGNNTITYYLGTVLDTAGVTSVPTQLAINIGLSVWNLCCAIIGSLYVDTFDRRGGFIVSTTSMGLTLILNSILTKLYSGTTNAPASAATVFLIFLFYSFYSLIWTPLSYLYPIEVLSYSLRANGLAVFNGACYLAAFFNTYVIPYAIEWSGLYFPETKKMALEEIDFIFDRERHFDAVVTIGEVVGVKGEKVDVKEKV